MEVAVALLTWVHRTVLFDLDRFGEIPSTHIQRFAGHVPVVWGGCPGSGSVPGSKVRWS